MAGFGAFSADATEAERGPTAPLFLAFNEGTAPSGSVVRLPVNAGTAALRVDVVTRSGGAATRVAGMASRWALSLPAFNHGSDPARAVLRVRAIAGGDPLSPGTNNFAFGADFRLDDVSTGGPTDDGDNLVQRGLYNDPAQYKVEVDGGRIGCRVKGSAGDVSVRSPVRVQPNTWYRAICRRHGDQVTMRVAPVSSAGVGSFTFTTATGATGVVDMGNAVPMSAGGKLKSDGSMDVTATDQLNGAVDRVVYRHTP